MSAHDHLDVSMWPIAKYRMPDSVPDEQAEEHVAAFEALLTRNERFALVFHGPEMPSNSKLFLKLYSAWFKRTRAQQKKLCAGAIRIEPDEKKRRSFLRKAFTYANSLIIPYPYKIVATNEEADALARQWLARPA